MNFNGNKSFRLLSMYEQLNKGDLLNKATLAARFGVTEKTIQRDIDDLRAYLADTHFEEGEVFIQYDRVRNGYFLIRMEREWLTNEEVLGICKILLESRTFCKEELERLLGKLLMQITPNDRKQLEHMIQNEQLYYVPPRHGKKLLHTLWSLSLLIAQNELLQISYQRMDGVERKHCVKPVAIMASEFYLYLIAYLADGTKDSPTVFRVDRITKFCGTGEHFCVPYTDRFNTGEFRKRVQFMYSGELQTVRFAYSGPSIEAVLDRLPTARILSQENGTYQISAEVYGKGIDMWLRSQGESVVML